MYCFDGLVSNPRPTGGVEYIAVNLLRNNPNNKSHVYGIKRSDGEVLALEFYNI